MNIDNVVEKLNVMALLLAVVHRTGDMSLLRGSIRNKALNPLEQGSAVDLVDGFTPEDAGKIRNLARAAFADGLEPARLLSDSEIDEMIRYVSGNEYSPGIAAVCRELATEGAPPAQKLDGAQDFPVAIIGAGQGGIAAAVRMQQMGIPYVLFEKNEGVGGTWFENTYPGVRVDVPGHSYHLSYAPNHDWSCYFPLGDEIRRYYTSVSDKLGVTRNTRYSTEVLSATYDEPSGMWQLVVRTPGGATEQHDFRAVISAVGQLNRPRWPDIAGLDTFEGTLVHSAMWQQELDLTGLRVGVIGSGATAFQIIPRVASLAAKTVVLQRSPAWMYYNGIYADTVSDEEKWALHHLPHYAQWYRFALLHAGFEGVYNETRVDPTWTKPGAVSALNENLRIGMTQFYESQIKDPELLAKLLPDYPPFGKRILQDNGAFLQAMQSESVTLDTSKVVKVTPTGIVTADGEYELDVLICATGFMADRFLFPMEICGVGGVSLSDCWAGDDARAYLGMTIPDFPNFFCIYGPNTNWVVSGSVVINAEYQSSYIGQCLEKVIRDGCKSIAVRKDIHDAYNEEVDALNATAAWGVDTVSNWYKNKRGRVTANLPLRPLDYWDRLRNPDFADYELHK